MCRVYPTVLLLLSVRRHAPLVRATPPSGSDGPQRRRTPRASRYSVSNKPPAAEQLNVPLSLSAMISPLKDIVIATVLGVAAGSVWNNFKDGEMDRISRFYKWYDAQEAQKNAHADD
ncbi:uncharacterized protein IUM83_18186 [Phytophthora cinnamomi]|uniref:uncharacterized protein n=1 Tax=Phytophthora cinnamomi TaxID=4785 RepID=UPI00355A9B0C|nr:hypothetical protein IUM83_18186 [Phytophthora cinnamomi]